MKSVLKAKLILISLLFISINFIYSDGCCGCGRRGREGGARSKSNLEGSGNSGVKGPQQENKGEDIGGKFIKSKGGDDSGKIIEKPGVSNSVDKNLDKKSIEGQTVEAIQSQGELNDGFKNDDDVYNEPMADISKPSEVNDFNVENNIEKNMNVLQNDGDISSSSVNGSSIPSSSIITTDVNTTNLGSSTVQQTGGENNIESTEGESIPIPMSAKYSKNLKSSNEEVEPRGNLIGNTKEPTHSSVTVSTDVNKNGDKKERKGFSFFSPTTWRLW